MKIYVASSWKNKYYDEVKFILQERGHKVWDWRKPPTGGNGFSWSQIDPDYNGDDQITPNKWNNYLKHEIAQRGFSSDLTGMNWCDVGVLLFPCGNSAHLEAGWMAGRGKTVHVLAQDCVRPDLMVLALNGGIFDNTIGLIKAIEGKS